MSMLLALPLGAFLVGTMVPTPVEDLRAVYFYMDRFYENADPPFAAYPREIVAAASLNEDRLGTLAREQRLVIEVCRFVVREDGSFREPEGLLERRLLCARYGEPEESGSP